VLVPPGGPKAPQLFRPWQAVYDASLLTTTYRLLASRDVIRVPEDVQQLVDAVYEDPTLATGLESALAARLGDEIARRELAKLVVIPGPRDIDCLVPLTDSDADPEMLATRFDADSVRALPVFADDAGGSWLNRERTLPLPRQNRAPQLDECREIIRYTVPVRGGPWLKGHDARSALPKSWHRNVHLRDLILLPHVLGADGTYSPAVIGDREFLLDDVLGLRINSPLPQRDGYHLTSASGALNSNNRREAGCPHSI
jgi:CRISPR-associated endonuclease/helicase Cas3